MDDVFNTHRYGFHFDVPVGLRYLPVPFFPFIISMDGDGNVTAAHTLDSWYSLPGKEMFFTPSGTHIEVDANIVNPDFIDDFKAELIKLGLTDYNVYTSKDVAAHGMDADQSKNIWAISNVPEYPLNYQDYFVPNSSLYIYPEES